VEVDRATLRETRELSALDQMGLDDLIEEIERVGKKKKGKR
jgi:hypothetical protein